MFSKVFKSLTFKKVIIPFTVLTVLGFVGGGIFLVNSLGNIRDKVSETVGEKTVNEKDDQQEKKMEVDGWDQDESAFARNLLSGNWHGELMVSHTIGTTEPGYCMVTGNYHVIFDLEFHEVQGKEIWHELGFSGTATVVFDNPTYVCTPSREITPSLDYKMSKSVSTSEISGKVTSLVRPQKYGTAALFALSRDSCKDLRAYGVETMTIVDNRSNEGHSVSVKVSEDDTCSSRVVEYCQLRYLQWIDIMPEDNNRIILSPNQHIENELSGEVLGMKGSLGGYLEKVGEDEDIELIEKGDKVSTLSGETLRARLNSFYDTESELIIGSNTEIEMTDDEILELWRGKIHIILKNIDTTNMKVTTQQGNVAPRGTDFTVLVREDLGTWVIVHDGEVYFENMDATEFVTLIKGQYAFIDSNGKIDAF